MRLLLVLVGLLVPGSAMAQDWATREVCEVETPAIFDDVFDPPGRAALEAEAAKISNGVGRFWQITAPKGAISHLWGTYHSAHPRILDLPEIVKDTIDTANTVAIEIDYTSPTRNAFRDAQYFEARYKEATDPFALLPPSSTIADLTPEMSDWIRDRALELGWTEDADLILSPAGMAEMLLSDPCEDFISGIIPIQDDYIQVLGRIAGADILSLENPQDFFTDLAADPDTAEAIIAVYTAYLKPATSNRERATGLALYLAGRTDMMFAWDKAFIADTLGRRGKEALARTNAYLIDFRNTRFLDRLTQPLESGRVFIAVGAGHLPGERGMISLLRNAGYQVTRVPLPGEPR